MVPGVNPIEIDEHNTEPLTEKAVIGSLLLC
jgi:hypothetical protein